MSAVEAIKTIVSVEEKAKQIIEDARRKAAEMKHQAESQVNEIHAKTLESAKHEAETIRKKAQVDAEAEAKAFLKESERSASKEIEVARAKVKDAVNAVVQLVVGGTQS